MKQLSIFIAGLLFLSVLHSCKKDDQADAYTSFTIALSLGGDLAGISGISLEGAEVVLTNQSSSQQYKVYADAGGIVNLEGVSIGNYTISAVQKVSAEEYLAATSVAVSDSVTLNGSVSSQGITQMTTQIDIVMVAGRSGNLVIKQVYYAGSNALDGAIFRDQFVEIYNNSSDTIYLDGIYLGIIAGDNADNPNLSLGYSQSNGAWDWSKSIGMTTAAGLDANKDFIYAEMFYRFPGTGKDYLLEPGQSAIVAQNAQNHRVAFTNQEGRSFSVNNPDLTVDLSGADFEVYYGNIPGYVRRAADSDTDNPAVADLQNIKLSGRDFVLNANGHRGVFLLDKSVNYNTLSAYPSPNITNVSESTELFIQVPVASVIDAVELNHTNPSSRSPRKFVESLDAGFAFVPAGRYSSQSLVRKTVRTVDGRRILQDTNNSTSDFNYLEKADPSKSASSFEGKSIQ